MTIRTVNGLPLTMLILDFNKKNKKSALGGECGFLRYDNWELCYSARKRGVDR